MILENMLVKSLKRVFQEQIRSFASTFSVMKICQTVYIQ